MGAVQAVSEICRSKQRSQRDGIFALGRDGRSRLASAPALGQPAFGAVPVRCGTLRCDAEAFGMVSPIPRPGAPPPLRRARCRALSTLFGPRHVRHVTMVCKMAMQSKQWPRYTICAVEKRDNNISTHHDTPTVCARWSRKNPLRVDRVRTSETEPVDTVAP